MRRLRNFDLVGSERAKELIIDTICDEVLERHPYLKIWKAAPLQSADLIGTVAYLLAPKRAYLASPLLCVVEAKKDDFEQGLAHCLVEMQACQWNNQQNNRQIDIYGVVTNGTTWQFYKLVRNGQVWESLPFSISSPQVILGILAYVFTQCEQNL
jgi:hypothetical protein